jgi:flagellar basal-body rod protein FlgC
MSELSIPNAVDIAIRGLRAEAARMNVIAGNIANSSTTRTASGQPYRRQRLILSAAAGELAGPVIGGVLPDTGSPFKRVYQPGHPDADTTGYVLMPNVNIPMEMMQLVTASRAYQASAAVMKRYQEMMELTVELLR